MSLITFVRRGIIYSHKLGNKKVIVLGNIPSIHKHLHDLVLYSEPCICDVCCDNSSCSSLGADTLQQFTDNYELAHNTSKFPRTIEQTLTIKNQQLYWTHEDINIDVLGWHLHEDVLYEAYNVAYVGHDRKIDRTYLPTEGRLDTIKCPYIKAKKEEDRKLNYRKDWCLARINILKLFEK